MENQSGHIMTLANSIIGVSILAMPYCFKQCGIILSVLMLLISSIISRLACHFLLKSAIIARRKTFEYLAFHIFGSLGKLAIEIGMIGFLLGTCIAFFVVMGDLGPEIIAKMTGIYTTNTMRTSILMALALFCVLPLGLLRNVDSLNGVSKATICFYCCLVLKIVFEAIPHIFSGDWYNNVDFWKPAGILQCLPIFSMALFCQTQLFEIFQALPNATLDKMNNVVRIAVNICTLVYISVGLFGYIAFSHKQFTGNILLTFSPSLLTDVIKIGFVLSVAFSFPLVIFPCRASLYSLFYKEGYSLHEGTPNYIPEGKFKGLTMFIVFLSLIIGILIPNIELVLGLVGSTIGVMICVLFPVTCFICMSPKNTNERILAQLMLMIGIFVMVLGTYKNLHTLDKLELNTVTIDSLKNFDKVDLNVVKAVEKMELPKDVIEKVSTDKIVNVENKIEIKKEPVRIELSTLKPLEEAREEVKEVRHEPPQPIEPQEDIEKNIKDENVVKSVTLPNVGESKVRETKLSDINIEIEKKLSVNDTNVDRSNDEVDAEAIKKEEREVELQEKETKKNSDPNQVLIDTIQQQNEVQKEIVEQQKKLIEVIQSQQKNVETNEVHKVHEEKVKAMKQIESIALKAIEKISGGKDETLAADVEKRLEAKIEENVKKENVKETVQDVKMINIGKDTDINIDLGRDKKDSVNIIDKKELPEPEIIIEKRKLVEESKNNIPLSDKNTGMLDNKVIEVDIINDNEETNKKKDILGETVPQENKVIKDISLKVHSDSHKNEKNPEPQSVNISNINNTAPLFLKLGISDNKIPDAKLKNMVPLPIAVSNNLNRESNLSKVDSPVVDTKMGEANKEKIGPLVNDDDLSAMKRDILMFKSRKR